MTEKDAESDIVWKSYNSAICKLESQRSSDISMNQRAIEGRGKMAAHCFEV